MTKSIPSRAQNRIDDKNLDKVEALMVIISLGEDKSDSLSAVYRLTDLYHYLIAKSRSCMKLLGNL